MHALLIAVTLLLVYPAGYSLASAQQGGATLFGAVAMYTPAAMARAKAMAFDEKSAGSVTSGDAEHDVVRQLIEASSIIAAHSQAHRERLRTA